MLLRLSRIVFFTGIFLLPLIFVPSIVNGFEGSKVWFFHYWVLTLVVTASIWIASSPGIKFNRVITILVFGYFFWIFITSLKGVDPVASFYGLFWRQQGVITQACYVGLFFVIINILRNRDRSLLVKVLVSCGFSLCVFVLLGIVANWYLDWPIYKYLERFSGTLGNPNFLAGVLGIIFPLIFGIKNWWVRLVLAPIFLVTIYLSGSRGGFIALVVSALALLWVQLFRQNKGIALTLFFIVLGGSVLWFSFWVQKIPWTDPNFAASRQRIWARGLMAVNKKPVLGYGLENYYLAVLNINYPKILTKDGEVFVDKAHNESLENLVAGGAPALILWGAIVILALRRFYLKKDLIFLAALVVFVVKAQTNVVSVSEYTLFWTLVGFSAISN